MFDNQDSFKSITKNVTASVIDSLGESFTQTGTMKKLLMMQWPTNLQELIYASATIEVSDQELRELISVAAKAKDDDVSFVDKEITVEMLDLCWFFALSKNFVAFSTILTVMPVSFYSTKFTITVLNHFWNETQYTIVKSQFLPYCLLVVLIIVHFHQSLSPESA